MCLPPGGSRQISYTDIVNHLSKPLSMIEHSLVIKLNPALPIIISVLEYLLIRSILITHSYGCIAV